MQCKVQIMCFFPQTSRSTRLLSPSTLTTWVTRAWSWPSRSGKPWAWGTTITTRARGWEGWWGPNPLQTETSGALAQTKTLKTIMLGGTAWSATLAFSQPRPQPRPRPQPWPRPQLQPQPQPAPLQLPLPPPPQLPRPLPLHQPLNQQHQVLPWHRSHSRGSLSACLNLMCFLRNVSFFWTGTLFSCKLLYQIGKCI